MQITDARTKACTKETLIYAKPFGLSQIEGLNPNGISQSLPNVWQA